MCKSRAADAPEPPVPATEHGWSFAETERRQLLAGLELTPLERLRWLDRRKEELQGLLGRAAAADRRASEPSE